MRNTAGGLKPRGGAATNNIQGSPVVAQNDDGQQITEQDLMTESYQKPLQGSTAGLLPPFDFSNSTCLSLSQRPDLSSLQLSLASQARSRTG